MRNNLPKTHGFGAFSLLIVGCCIVLVFGLAVAAPQGNANNSNAGAKDEHTNPNSNGTAQGDNKKDQENKEGGNHKADTQ